MTVRVLDEAAQELVDAIIHYEKIDAGLGLRLKKEARRAMQWIDSNPEVPRLRPRGYRRLNLQVFPYYIAYFIWADGVWVLAFAHGHREPEYWIDRIRKLA